MIKVFQDYPYELIGKRWPNTSSLEPDLREYVSKIVDDVHVRGDDAVTYYSRKFDNVELQKKDFTVKKEEIEESYNYVTSEQIDALQISKERIELLESNRLKTLEFTYSFDGVKIKNGVRPLQIVGCYVPGGKASYPSTLLMNVVPARVAGVKRIIVATPPGMKGRINPLLLVAADICDVDQIYRVGGVQAIASIAYGTETIEKVDKIVGPGNIYVTTAKNVVSEFTAIDKPAGPSEILIVGDDSAEPEFIALDLISQAEHGQGGVSGLVTTSKRLAEEVEVFLKNLLVNIPGNVSVSEIIEENGFIYIVNSLEEAIDFVNSFAPEHVELMTGNPEKMAEKINNAGLILVGPYSPVSATDYCMGVNHVLPTNGYGKIYGSMSVLDYVRPVSTISISKDGLKAVKGSITALADAEGLFNHSNAVEGRFK